MEAKDVRQSMYQKAYIQVQAAKEVSGQQLDFSPDSLALLDELIDKYVPKEPYDAGELALVIGAYVGETLRKALSMEWGYDESRGAPCLIIGTLRLYPVARARARLELGARASLAHYVDVASTYVGSGGSTPPPEEEEAPPSGLLARLFKGSR